MTAETKAYIEKHISSIENNGLASAYLNCPLQILNDFNNTLHIAGIYYPLEIHTYVVVCCYIAARFKYVRLQSYDFEYGTEKECYEFDCDCCKYDVDRLTHDISVLLPRRTVNVIVEEKCNFAGHRRILIRVEVN